MTFINMCFVLTSKDRRGHLVEWVEKSSFAILNKLFEIDQSEWSHSVLFTENNLEVVLTQAKPFVISFFPRLAPLTLVLGDHFLLKDLPFYKVTPLTDTEVRQACLDAHKKKMLKGDFMPSPWFRFLGGFKSYPLANKEKEDYCLTSGSGDRDQSG